METAVLFWVWSTEFDLFRELNVQCSLCCLQNLAVGLLPVSVTIFFLLNRGLDLNSKAHLACCPASGQDQLYLRTGQTTTNAMGAASVCSSALLPLALDIRKNIPTRVILIEYLLLS